jgi:hypothetical protein
VLGVPGVLVVLVLEVRRVLVVLVLEVRRVLGVRPVLKVLWSREPKAAERRRPREVSSHLRAAAGAAVDAAVLAGSAPPYSARRKG